MLEYVHALYEAVSTPGIRESAQINNMKKYMNFIGLGVEPTGEFLHGVRRATTCIEFFTLCPSSSITTNRCRSSPSPSL